MAKPKVDISFTSDVARNYEASLVPLIFQPYAGDLAARVRALNPATVLEIGCGTGVVTRALADHLPERCAILATDLNEAMVAHGRAIGTSRPVEWRQADVMGLPFDDGSFDAVVCQFSVMFFPDRVAAYREVRRVLRPAGAFVFNVWNDIERNDFAHVVTEALRTLYPHDPPAFLARTPHGHGAPGEIEGDLRAAGFRSVELVQRDDVSVASGPEVPAIAYCQGTPLRNEILARDPGGLERATEVATDALRARFGAGRIEGRISGVVVLAT
ncbi:MAG: class I SAM-dependent methyltransferase [Gemmatimonadota bacterium]|nr:class I SAM-dependent methyltransferase [Gemmatimonadota bacterium]